MVHLQQNDSIGHLDDGRELQGELVVRELVELPPRQRLVEIGLGGRLFFLLFLFAPREHLVQFQEKF